MTKKRQSKRNGPKFNKNDKKDGGKKNQNNPNKKMKRDPGIPNLAPFKDEMLQQKQRKEDANENKDNNNKKRDFKKKEKKRTSIAEMAKLQFDAVRKATEYENKQKLIGSSDDTYKSIKKDAISGASKRTYYREFKKVIQAADVIIEVLDARDPNGCRSPDIEKTILSQDKDKKIILLLNKIDLVPREVVERWLTSLRGDFPALAFKSNTASNASKYKRAKRGWKKGANNNDNNNNNPTEDMDAALTTDVNNNSNNNSSSTATDNTGEKSGRGYVSSDVVGSDILVQLLKNYCRSKNIKKTITVGIIGYPNVGKSSVINSLKRSKVVNVGNMPGLTKSAQEVYLDHNIKLLDCPGIIFSSSNLDSDLILRNCVKIEQLDDPVYPVEVILKRCTKEKLMDLYKIPAYTDVFHFLNNLAQKRGKLLKGGVPDIESVARTVLQDWNSGKIPFYTLPPQMHNSVVDAINAENNQFVYVDPNKPDVKDTMKEFDIDDLIAQTEKLALANLPSLQTHADQFIPLASTGFGTVEVYNSDDENVNDDKKSRKRSANEMDLSSEEESDDDDSDEDSHDDDMM